MSLRSAGLALSVFVVAVLLGMALYTWVAPESGALAELRQVQGEQVERDFAEHVGSWSHARAGALFVAGDGMRTHADTSAILALADESELRVSPNTTLRFLAQPEGEQDNLGVDVQSGEAVIHVGKRDLPLRTHIGRATLLAGSLVSLTRNGDGIDFAIKVGKLQFEDGQGKAHSLAPGERVRLGIGMAELQETEGEKQKALGLSLQVGSRGARVRAPGSPAFDELAPGTHALSAGSELALDKGVRAVLRRGEDRAELRGEGTYIVGDEILIDAQRGEATIESRSRDMAVRVPGGVIIVRSSDGRARLSVTAKNSSVEVLSGKVSTNVQGQEEELAAGAQRSWPNEAEREDPTDGSLTEAPSYFNMTVPAGESFVLHAPELPVSAAFDLGTRCPGEAEIELVGVGGQKTRGQTRINMLLSARSRAYNVRCVNDKGVGGRVVARGTLRVLLDPGTRKLPPTPPTSLADADGRTYTVYYSNQPPAVRVRWPNAPSADSYTLTLDKKERTVTQAEHVFGSGDLRDGVHEFSFRAGMRGSRTTFIDVRFDNNAPTASVQSPADRSFASGQPVQVEGVSLPAWKVALTGGTLQREADGRFAGSIVPSAEHPDVVVRLSHPRLGVHYYLRRAGDSP